MAATPQKTPVWPVYMSCNVCRTLRADQHQRQVGGVPEVGEATEVVINRLETDLILQTEDEDHSVDPQRKLQRETKTHFHFLPVSSCLFAALNDSIYLWKKSREGGKERQKENKSIIHKSEFSV